MGHGSRWILNSLNKKKQLPLSKFFSILSGSYFFIIKYIDRLTIFSQNPLVHETLNAGKQMTPHCKIQFNKDKSCP